MKKLLLALMLLPSFSHAYEIWGNPDKFPTLRLGMHTLDLSGISLEQSSIGYYWPVKEFRSDDLYHNTQTMYADLTLPISEILSVELGADYVEDRFNLHDYSLSLGPWYSPQQSLLTQKYDLSGYGLNLGIKLFFK